MTTSLHAQDGIRARPLDLSIRLTTDDGGPPSKGRGEPVSQVVLDPPIDAGRNLLASARRLSEHLLHSETATQGLLSWCEARNIGVGPIYASHRSTPSQVERSALDEDVLDHLCPRAGETIMLRSVSLRRGDFVLSEAENWFILERLPGSMRDTLASTSTPFGAVVAPLQPRRRTFFVDLTGAFEMTKSTAPNPSYDQARTVVEHRAVVCRGIDGQPLAVVREAYREVLLA
jgi:hypothetical protein